MLKIFFEKWTFNDFVKSKCNIKKLTKNIEISKDDNRITILGDYKTDYYGYVEEEDMLEKEDMSEQDLSGSDLLPGGYEFYGEYKMTIKYHPIKPFTPYKMVNNDVIIQFK
ncbi:hypothetical protein Catovirus_1_127 [Catovirus CTV1]|uniref:Uncharacterized protein n=1 Tax=Catovirus CTV1 TaxID=1977631 RepID=A0A1V0S8P1_9VIRU|nr:hypothetical protein Catovirus_1_127 [Catovirus CTV1]